MVIKLTLREAQALELLMQDKGPKEVALDMGIGWDVVNSHLRKARRRNGCKTTHELLLKIDRLRHAGQEPYRVVNLRDKSEVES